MSTPKSNQLPAISLSCPVLPNSESTPPLSSPTSPRLPSMLPPHSPPISPVSPLISPLSGPHSPPISLSSPSMSPSMSPLSGPHSSPISLSSPSMSPLLILHSPPISLSSPSMSPLLIPHSPPISLLSPTMSPQPPTISPKPPPLSPLSSSMLMPRSFQSSSTSELSSASPKPFLANHQSPSLSLTKLLQSNSKLPESYSPSLLPSTHSVMEPKKSIAKDIDCLRILPLNKKLEHSQLPPYIQDVLPDNCSYMFSSFEYLCKHTKAFRATMFIKNVEILHADRSVNPSAQDIYYLF